MQKRGSSQEFNKAPKTGEIHLIFCNHAFDNYPRILDAVAKSKPDIIAVELAAETALMRLDFEHEVNTQLSGGPASEVANDLGYLEEDIIERFKGEDIVYVTIDAELDSEAGQLVAQAERQRREYEKHADDDSSAGAAYRRFHAKKYIDATARGDIMREKIMAQQLEVLAAKYPGKRITAIIGMLHDQIADTIAEDIPIEIAYVPRAEDEERGLRGRFTRYELGQRALAAGTMSLDQVMVYCLDKDSRFIGYDDDTCISTSDLVY